jgi:hypothetical protein
MLLYHIDGLCKGTLLLMAAIAACVLYAYYVDARRAADDPKKKNYHPFAIVLAVILAPFILILYVSFFLLRVLTYGVFLVVFIFALIFVRKPFILEALQKIATAIGNRLLEANTMLIRFFLSPWRDETGRI